MLKFRSNHCHTEENSFRNRHTKLLHLRQECRPALQLKIGLLRCEGQTLREQLVAFRRTAVPSPLRSSSGIRILALIDPKDQGIKILRKFRNFSPDDTAPHPRRLKSSPTLLSEHRISRTLSSAMQYLRPRLSSWLWHRPVPQVLTEILINTLLPPSSHPHPIRGPIISAINAV